MAATMASPLASTTVRCSSCNTEIDIARASEHVCPAATLARDPSLSAFDRLNQPASSPGYLRSAPVTGKLPKFAPSRIDPFAANESFLTPQLGAGFYPDSMANDFTRAGSPASARFRMPPRSATTPHFRERSRSPDMLMSQDSAFPIFPTRKVREKEAKKDRQRSKSMSRSQSRDRGAWQPSNHANGASVSRSASPAFPQFPPRPSTAGTASRKNSISSVRSRSEQVPLGSPAEPVPPLPVQRDITGRSSPRMDANAGISHGLVSPANNQPVAPLIGSQINRELDSYQEILSENAEHSRQHDSPIPVKFLDTTGGIRKPSYEHSSVVQRGQDAGGYRDISGTETASSIPEPMSATVEKPPHDWTSDTTVPASLTIRKPPSAPETSQHGATSVDSLASLPSLKPSEHIVTDSSSKQRVSTSSDGSTYSRSHSISSQSSPPTSASSFMLHDATVKEDISEDTIRESGEKLGRTPTQDLATSAAVSSVPSSSTASQQQRGPAKSFSRPNYTRPQMDLLGSVGSLPTQSSPRSTPAQQSLSNFSPKEDQSVSSSIELRQVLPESKSPNSDLRTPTSLSPGGFPDRPFSPMSTRTPQASGTSKAGDAHFNMPRRPNTPGIKGNCRGCGEMIVGKSVSSADGRLQGRYHKKCFVCQTCKEPFQTVDFYVINNQPYCQRHYHTLNGSLCGNCDRGIEGPYMETDAKRKFHPHCFTCKECHLILRSDYFEVNGIIYCEKHSRKPDLLGPGRRYPERRTTRLMMM